MNFTPSDYLIRSYQPSDEPSWLRCRALSFLSSQYYDDVKPHRTVLIEPAIALVAVSRADGNVLGVLDIECNGNEATIDTVAVHPDHQHKGIASSLLSTALAHLEELGTKTLDAWTREDLAANSWYLHHKFVENYRYMHVYLGEPDDHGGFSTPQGLSSPVIAFMHGAIEDEVELRERYARVYICRQYVRPVSLPQDA